MEKTFIICKPDAMQKRLVGTVISRFEAAGFDVIACKMTRLSPALLREHYAHVASKPFYPEIERFMSSRPVVMIALQGENAVQRVRDLLGPTDSRKAAKGTLRGDFGTDMMINVVHASDSVENGLAEIARFFRPEEVFAWSGGQALKFRRTVCDGPVNPSLGRWSVGVETAKVAVDLGINQHPTP